MATVAKTLCLFLSHDPRVRLVAVKTFDSFFQMKIVLSYRRLIPVTFSEAVRRFEFYLSMGLVALVTQET